MSDSSNVSQVVHPVACGIHVPGGKDRNQQNELLIWGLIPLSVKISTADTDGRLFMFEHCDMGKGGPPRHVHHNQDEWFYVTKGRYVFEIGNDRFELTAGDSIFAPRQIEHAWACVEDPGTLLTMLTPAGSFETFILDTTKYSELPSMEEVAKSFADHGMTVVGPPLHV
jgi:mannose-6-phosphate isomerase-like protein (cupin superfamily)